MYDHYQAPVVSFINYLQFEKRYSQHTVSSYRVDLEQFFTYLTGQYQSPPLAEIAPVYVRSWLAELKNDTMTAKSINRKISTLKSFFKYHLKTGTIEQTPMGKIISPKISKRLPVFIKEEDTKRLISASGKMTEDWKSLNTHLLVSLFYGTGMRLTEFINLRENQVDLGKRQLKVLGKGNKERIIPVTGALSKLVKEYIQYKRK